MKPGKPLVRKTPMKRTTGPARTPMKKARPKPSVPTAVRKSLAERSQGDCEMYLPGCTGAATEVSHRIKRGTGGRHGTAEELSNRLSNLLHACRECHAWCHARPAEAYDLGLILREHQDPLTEPANTCRYGPVWLDDQGGMWPADGVA